MPPVLLPAIALLAVLVCGTAEAADTAVVRLQGRLQASSTDAVNAYLDTDMGWKQDGLPFFNQVKQCNRSAMKLMLALVKSTNASATKANNDLLELAMGRCPDQLLPLVPPDSVHRLCTVDAWAESKSKVATVAEQRAEVERRIKSLSSKEATATSANGKSCLAAYATKRDQLSRDQ